MLRFVSRALSLYRTGRALPTRALTEEQLLAKYGINQKPIDYNDLYCKHRQQVAVPHTNAPKVAPNAFVAPCATLAGNVEVWDNSSIWYGCVIRADVRLVRIGARTNIQDRTVITEAHHPLHADHDGSTIVGHNVTVGHRCILRACTIEDESHIGMGSILMEGSYVEGGSMIGAGSVLLPHTRVPSGQLWLGNPARYVRDLTTEEQIWINTTAQHYSQTADVHAEEFILPYAMDAVHEAEQLGYTIGYQESIEYR